MFRIGQAGWIAKCLVRQPRSTSNRVQDGLKHDPVGRAGQASGIPIALSRCSKEPWRERTSRSGAGLEKTTIQHTVVAEAVLFPLAQSAIVPKISAPVKTLLVKRGSRVHAAIASDYACGSLLPEPPGDQAGRVVTSASLVRATQELQSLARPGRGRHPSLTRARGESAILCTFRQPVVF
jgi:hypothetical protein